MHDRDGNPVPEIDPLSSAGQLVALLHHARKHRFKLGPYVKVGDVVVQVQDLDQGTGRDLEMPVDRGPWAAAGYDPDAKDDGDE